MLAIAAVGIGIVATQANKEYTVTYNYNDGENPSTEKYRYKVNTVIDEPSAPELRLGYWFVYWCSDKEATNEVVFPYKVTGDVTFYARWSESIAQKYFYLDYLTKTDTGKALVQSNKVTTGVTNFVIGGEKVNGTILASGNTFAVIDTGSDKYKVVDIVNMRELFTIPSGAIVVYGFDHSKSYNEFFCVQYNDGFYLYDLTGKSYGPTSSNAKMVLSDTVLFDNKFYRFDSKGSLKVAFSYDADVHIPNGGNGTLFYELETINGGKQGYAINILNSNYKVVNTIKCSSPADYYSCTPLSNGKFLVQYAVQVSNDADYTFKEQISEKKYLMKSYIVGDNSKDNNEIENMKRPIILTQDRYNTPSIDWDKYANETVALVQIGVVNSGGVLSPKFEQAKISDDGRTVTRMYDTGIGPVDTQSLDVMGDGKHYMAYIYGNIGGKTISSNIIVDGTGKTFQPILPNMDNYNSLDKFYSVDNYNSVKYFYILETKYVYNTETKLWDEVKTYSDTNIYDIDGKVVGNFSGKTPMGATNNDLFFHDESKIYIFKDGSMSELCAYDGAEKPAHPLRIYDSCYSYYDGQKYIVCSENGKQISTSTDGLVSIIENTNGDSIIHLVDTSNQSRLFVLTRS